MPQTALKRRPLPAPPPSPAAEVWDLPVRIFHWALVGLLVTAAISGKIGGDAMELHLQAGYAIAILVAFRLLWGFVGTTHARFTSFIRGIRATLAYGRQMLRGEPYVYPGHNPLGGWMVIAMLAVLALQAGTGLFANDDIMTEGPLFSLVSKDMSDYLTAIHKLNFKLLAGLAGVHVGAIAFYLAVKRINLVRPMITGRRPDAAEHSQPGRHRPLYTNALALAVLAMVTTGFYLLVRAA